jgi:uncharacterized SAM-binding protein YcdF (DUF218 family)
VIWEIGTVAKHLVLPPVGLGWLLLIALLQFRKRVWVAKLMVATTLVLGLMMALPLVAGWLTRLVVMPAAAESEYSRAQAIVILGGGRGLVWDASHETIVDAYPGAFTLQRIHAGARLARRIGLPVLVTSGAPDGYDPTEAEVMRRILEAEWGIKVRWVEDKSRNTGENADFTARILLPQGISTVILVTSDFHLRRAMTVFGRAGFEALPHPVPPLGTPGPIEWNDFIPNAQSLMRSHYAIHELAGTLYSLLRASATPSATVGN